jgi:uncharacterized protein (UPF0332 family)
MTEQQRALLEKAQRALEGAAANLTRDDAEIVTNRAYYACFYAASAALLGVGERPKTHSGVLRRFRFHFVRAGPLEAAVGDLLGVALDARQRSDYDTAAITDLRAAADLLADAERFVAAVRVIVEEGPTT